MSFSNNLKLQQKAREGAYAVPAFNTSNLEITQAIVEVAEELRSPVIIATSPSAIEYAGIEEISRIVRSLAARANVPISLHLDHGKDIKTVVSCIRYGWTSVMIDGSHLPFEENLALTREVVNIAHSVGISVEAELGKIGGTEDLISISEREATFTDPDEAALFVSETGCDTLAVAIGTSHGAYKFKGKPELDFERLSKIADKVKTPLVLHGASSVIPELVEKAGRYGASLGQPLGVPPQDIKEAVKRGITKVNIDTDIRLAFTAGIREFLYENPNVFDPRKIISAAKREIREVIASKIKILDSDGKV
jgi:fructose-bisphosphate aldolase class II